MFKELCLCGIPKIDHIDLELLSAFVGTIDAAVARQRHIEDKLSQMIYIYGNTCYDYRRDNLRYLEEVSNG